LFHETSGEWEALLTKADRGKARTVIHHCLRTPPIPSSEIHMFFAPPRPQRLDWMVEKVTEIGVTHLHPILTQRTVVRQIHESRLQKIAIEATEQSIRLQPPVLSPLTPAVEALTTQASDMPVFFCDPLATLPLTAVLATTGSAPKVALAVGPEGGWTPQERDQILNLPHSQAVHLGPQILRVETAALVATTLATLMHAGQTSTHPSCPVGAADIF
jgi:16S rRNA (uracil1498-N3)-methyltransferase